MAEEIIVINTTKKDLFDLSLKEIVNRLELEGLGEYVNLFTNYVEYKNSLTSTILRYKYVLERPGIAISATREKKSSDESYQILPRIIPNNNDPYINFIGGEQLVVRDIHYLPGTRNVNQSLYHDLHKEENTVFNIFWKYKELSFFMDKKKVAPKTTKGGEEENDLMQYVIMGERDAPDNLITYFVGRENFWDSVAAKEIMYNAIVPVSTKYMNSDYFADGPDDNKVDAHSFINGDQKKKLEAMGAVAEQKSYLRLLSYLINTNNYESFFKGRGLAAELDQTDFSKKLFIEALTRQTYINMLQMYLDRLRIRPNSPLNSKSTIQNIDIKPDERKLLLSKIKNDKERQAAMLNNNCAHIEAMRDVYMGEKTFNSGIRPFIGEIKSGQVFCNACKSIIMCEHTYNYYNGIDITKFYVSTDDGTFCGSCGEQLSEDKFEFTAPYVQYDSEIVNIISYQYNMIRKYLLFPPTINDRVIYRAIVSGIYQNVQYMISSTNAARGVTDKERSDRIYLTVYIHEWIYLLLLIEQFRLNIVIVQERRQRPNGKPLKKAKVTKNIDKIYFIIMESMGDILRRYPTIAVKTIIEGAVSTYFKGRAVGVRTSITNESTIIAAARLQNNPLINQSQLTGETYTPPSKNMNKLFKYYVEGTVLNRKEKTHEFVWPPGPDPSANYRPYILLPTGHDLNRPLGNKIAYTHFVTVAEYSRKVTKVIYAVDGEIVDSPLRPQNSTVEDVLDQNGVSMFEPLPGQYVSEMPKDIIPYTEMDKREVAKKEIKFPTIEWDKEFGEDVPVAAKYIGNTWEQPYDDIEKDTLPQTWSQFRLNVILGYLCNFITVKNEKLSLLSHFAIDMAIDQPVLIENISITAINLLVKLADKAQLESIIAFESGQARPTIISYSLLKAYVSKLRGEDSDEDSGIEPDADDIANEEGKTFEEADPYKNMDYEPDEDEEENGTGKYED